MEQEYEGLGWFDYVILLIAIGGGYYVSTLLPDAGWSLILSILVTYHLYLAWTIFSAGDRSLAMSVPMAVVTHLACLAVVIAGAVLRIPRGLLMLLSMFIPAVGILKFSLVAMVLFERVWLFSGGKTRDAAPGGAPTVRRKKGQPVIEPLVHSNELYYEWLELRSKKKNPEYRVGMNMQQEYDLWRQEEAIRRWKVEQAEAKAAKLKEPTAGA